MKVNVKVVHEDHSREFEIACGTGENKSFKWLTNVACQRFSLAAPNGALRHRDHVSSNTFSNRYSIIKCHFFDD